MIGEFAEVHGFGVVLGAYCHAHGFEEVGDFLVVENLVVHGFLHVEDFASQRKDGLECTVASLLCGSACGVTLDNEEFAVLGCAAGAVSEFSGQTAAAQRRLALYFHAGVVGGVACLCGYYHLLDNGACLAGILLEIIAERLAHGGLHSAYHLVVAEFRLGLAFKLRLHDLYGNHGCEALAEVVAGNVYLHLLEHLVVLGIFLEGGGESAAEAGEVCAALYGVDVVYEGIDVFVVGVVVGESHLHGDSLTLGVEMDHVVDERFLVGVDILHELAQTVL